jgi:FAD/FMN-containing dehydrogenase
VVKGSVLDDEVSRVLFSSGACLFQVRPLGVVQPQNKADVMKVVEYAARREIPLTARGAGTSRTGNELGHGIILDFSRYMNDVLEFDPTSRWVRVQPGIILSLLNSFLKPSNLFFPIDPSTMEFCTLGGMIANNSSGPHAVKYGTTRDHVLSLEVVLSNGEVITTRPISLKGETMQTFTGSSSREGKIYRALPIRQAMTSGCFERANPWTSHP